MVLPWYNGFYYQFFFHQWYFHWNRHYNLGHSTHLRFLEWNIFIAYAAFLGLEIFATIKKNFYAMITACIFMCIRFFVCFNNVESYVCINLGFWTLLRIILQGRIIYMIHEKNRLEKEYYEIPPTYERFVASL